jgi:hypothetical protein
MTDETSDGQLVKPKVIGNLKLVGNAVFLLSIISAVLLFTYSLQCVDYCNQDFAKSRFEREPENIVLIVVLIIGGWVQQQFVHGFSVGLDQLFEIRKNTSN